MKHFRFPCFSIIFQLGTLKREKKISLQCLISGIWENKLCAFFRLIHCWKRKEYKENEKFSNSVRERNSRQKYKSKIQSKLSMESGSENWISLRMWHGSSILFQPKLKRLFDLSWYLNCNIEHLLNINCINLYHAWNIALWESENTDFSVNIITSCLYSSNCILWLWLFLLLDMSSD